MASLVFLMRERDDDRGVTYRFGTDDASLGRLRLDKASGAVDELDPAPSVDAHALFVRAAAKARQHWRKNEYPRKTAWAS